MNLNIDKDFYEESMDLAQLIHSMPKGFSLYRCFTDEVQYTVSIYDGTQHYQCPLVDEDPAKVLRQALLNYPKYFNPDGSHK